MRKTIVVHIISVLFWTNCTGQTTKMTEQEYFEKAKIIWQNYVPKSGPSNFVQGELLRAIEKLRDEAHRNGNINFNKKCHGIFIQFLREKLSDKKVFDKKKIAQINKDLDKLAIDAQPYTQNDIFDRICDRIVDWNLFYGDEVKNIKKTELNC
jgi:hypothetical protein